MVERYIFIGEDGSLGLRRGETYRVSIKRVSEAIVAKIHSGTAVIRCPYRSRDTFDANWQKESDPCAIEIASLNARIVELEAQLVDEKETSKILLDAVNKLSVKWHDAKKEAREARGVVIWLVDNQHEQYRWEVACHHCPDLEKVDTQARIEREKEK